MTFRDLADFAHRFPTLASAALRDVVQRAHSAVHGRAETLARDLTPVRTGRTKDAWTSQPNPPDAAIRALQPTKLVNNSPAINILNRGIRSAKSYKVRRGGKVFIVPAGRRLGSNQARTGIKKRLLRALAAEDESIVGTAISGSSVLGELLR